LKRPPHWEEAVLGAVLEAAAVRADFEVGRELLAVLSLPTYYLWLRKVEAAAVRTDFEVGSLFEVEQELVAVFSLPTYCL
jgi:hypothetical protein